MARQLSWEPLEDKRACRIAILHESGGYAARQTEWPALITQVVDSMARLQKALRLGAEGRELVLFCGEHMQQPHVHE